MDLNTDPNLARRGMDPIRLPHGTDMLRLPTEISTPLSYGKVSPGTPNATLELSNKANGKVYVSLQGTARDGTNIIREYPVWGTFSVTIPAGYYYYVASVGGQEFTGTFNLPGHSSHSLTFHSNEVDAQ